MLSLIDGKIHPRGWIKDFLEADRQGITGNLDRLCADVSQDIFGEHRTKHETKDHWSSWWPGESEGNWSEAFVRLAFAMDHEELREKSRRIVYNFLEHQDSDGYIGIYETDSRYLNGPRSGDLWTQSRAMNTMLIYFHKTGDVAVRRGLERMADNIVSHYGPQVPGSFYEIADEDGSKTHGLMIIEPMLGVYALLHKESYLAFCEYLYGDYSTHMSVFPCDDIRSVNLIDPGIPFIGHGPHTCEQMRVLILLYEATKKETYLRLFNAAMVKLKRYLLLSGSCKSDEQIGAYLSELPEEARGLHNFEECTVLPTNGYEYCTTTELMFTFISALEITENMDYADLEEWMVYNAAMAARQPDGRAIEYLCADNLFEASHTMGPRWDYSPTHTDAAVCCAPNSCKIMPTHLESMWMKNECGLTAVFYGPCCLETTVRGTRVHIEELTQYPFEQQIRFKLGLEGPKAFELRFRIPAWAHKASVEVCGADGAVFRCQMDKVKITKEKEAVVYREWADTDMVTLSFDCGIELLTANDRTTALKYGPLLYAMEIKAQAQPYFAYDTAGFYDIDYFPEPDAQWNYTLRINPEDLCENAGICRQTSDGAPWTTPPVTMKVRMLDGYGIANLHMLVPIGCTILRRTTFPAVYVSRRKEQL